MTQNFKVLSEAEFDKLKDAISLITVYIAGADGEIETEELKWATKITSIRSYFAHTDLIKFYTEVGKDFEEKVIEYAKDLDQLEVRNKTVTEKLTELNPIMAKLDPKVGAALYKSFLSLANHVAKASGGFLGFFSISSEEKAILDLKMINPIIWEPNIDTPVENN